MIILLSTYCSKCSFIFFLLFFFFFNFFFTAYFQPSAFCVISSGVRMEGTYIFSFTSVFFIFHFIFLSLSYYYFFFTAYFSTLSFFFRCPDGRNSPTQGTSCKKCRASKRRRTSWVAGRRRKLRPSYRPTWWAFYYYY